MEGRSQKKLSKKEMMAEAARRANEKRKGSTTGEPIAKRTKSSFVEKGSTPTDLSPSGLEKKTTSDVVHAKPLRCAPLEGQSDEPRIEKPSAKSRKGKGSAEESDRTTIKISMPKGFMAEDTIDEEVFPLLEQFTRPSQQERFKGASIGDLDASIVGLFFMAFQSSLALHSKLAAMKKLVIDSSAREDAALRKFNKVVEQGKAIEAELHTKKVKIEDFKGQLEQADQVNMEHTARLKMAEDRVKALEGSLEALRKEKEDREATIMRRHVEGKNLMAAAEELSFYLAHVGSFEDLDADDEKDAEEEEG